MEYKIGLVGLGVMGGIWYIEQMVSYCGLESQPAKDARFHHRRG